MANDDELPKWLHDMIHAEFFIQKGFHKDDLKYFCTECGGVSLTVEEKESDHKGHFVMQPLKNSGEYGYLKSDLVRLRPKGLDIDDISSYITNSKTIIYPKQTRHYQKTSYKSGDWYCLTCRRNIVKKNGKFCSILCKLQHCGNDDHMIILDDSMMMGSNDVSKKLGFKSVSVKNHSNIKKKKKGSPDNEENFESLVSVVVDDQSKSSNKLQGFRKRSRKGTPCRAPLSDDLTLFQATFLP